MDVVIRSGTKYLSCTPITKCDWTGCASGHAYFAMVVVTGHLTPFNLSDWTKRQSLEPGRQVEPVDCGGKFGIID